MGKFYQSCSERLELWARQLGWLSAAPEVTHNGKGKPPDPVARIKRMNEQGKPVLTPEVPAPYLTEWFLEIGPSAANAMGEAPIGWQEMAAWQAVTGIELEGWEARALRSMSLAYLAQKHDGKKPDCPAPYQGENAIDPTVRDRVAEQFKAMAGAIAGKKTKR